MSEFYPIRAPAFDSPARSKASPSGRVSSRKLTAPPLEYELDRHGRVTPGHRVDQGMALSLTVRKGTISSSPNVGNDLYKVKTGLRSTDADVTDRVMNAFPLSRYVEEGEASIDYIRHEERPNGGLLVSVGYINLATNKADVAKYGDT